jgi:hypothetical protein
MHSKAMAVLAVLAACGGSPAGNPVVIDPDAGLPPPDGGTPPAATVLTAGVYQAAPAITARSALAVGPAMATTLIVDWSGSFSMVLPNYDFVQGSLRVNPDGGLQLCAGMVLVHQNGTVEPATITGSASGNTINGTINGTEPFTLVLTTIQTQDFTVAQMAGNYISASSSNGAWAVISIASTGNIQGYVYASQADAQLVASGAVLPGRNAVGYYYAGTIIHTDVPTSCQICTAIPNSYKIGFGYAEMAQTAGRIHPTTYGFAYFTAGGLVSLTVNPNTGDQFTAVFTKL